jgi:hypothetical protein
MTDFARRKCGNFALEKANKKDTSKKMCLFVQIIGNSIQYTSQAGSNSVKSLIT